MNLLHKITNGPICEQFQNKVCGLSWVPSISVVFQENINISKTQQHYLGVFFWSQEYTADVALILTWLTSLLH